MPKRSAEEKLERYYRKIQKIQGETRKNKRRRVIYTSDSSDSEKLEENCDVAASKADKPQPESFNDADVQMDSPPPQLLPASAPASIREQIDDLTAFMPHTEESEPPLDPDILSALGAGSSVIPEFGDSIHTSLANLWLPLLRKGLPKEEKENLTKEYLIPTNCKLLQAPKINAEISAAVSEIVRGRDRKLSNLQQELGVGISAINRGMDILLKTENKASALKKLSDGCRLLSHLHHRFTADRKKLIIPSLEKNILHIIQDTERDDTLFENSLGEKIKASKAIERQGNQIRNKTNMRTANPQTSTSRPVQQGNWNGPPRYTPNRGGRGGRGKSAPSAPRRHYPISTIPSTSKSLNQSRTRASTRQ